jgi:hypothetical protein
VNGQEKKMEWIIAGGKIKADGKELENTMEKTKVRITWNGMGGELDSVTVKVSHDDDRALTTALMELIRGNIVSPSDTFTVEEIA